MYVTNYPNRQDSYIRSKTETSPVLVPVSLYIKSLMLHCTLNEKYYLSRYVKCNKILY